jgi:hypothetical protein
LNWLASLVKSRRRLEAENLVLRHQVNILRRRAPRRIWLSRADRLAFVWLYRLCPAVVDAVVIIRPETLNPTRRPISSLPVCPSCRHPQQR